MPSPNALYSVAEIRSIEQAALAALPAFTLMQRAGQAAVKSALQILGELRCEAKVLVLAGPGNNGGDALEAASGLKQAGVPVTVLLYADPARQSADAREALERAKNSSVKFGPPMDFGKLIASKQWSLVVDGLFGIGLARAISSPLYDLIEAVNTLACPVLALDIPSGLDADTGNIVGERGIAIHATHTVTFIGNKPGLHTCFGRDYAGDVQVAHLDIDASYFKPPQAHLNTPESFGASVRPRRHNSHKGSYGDVIVVGGAHGMSGAAILASRAAAKCGAGRVFAAFIAEPPAYDSIQPELMCRLASDMDLSKTTLVIGPGMGTSQQAHALLAQALQANADIVIDADALNLIAVEPGLQQKLAHRQHATLITPHPLEAARLLGTSATHVQADRVAAARALAHRFNAVTILKGSGSIIAQADGATAINTTGNPALATAGTGDVLAGICGALLAQQWPVWNTALAATWLHGRAADILAEQDTGPIGLTASELIPCVRSILNQLIRQHVANHIAR